MDGSVWVRAGLEGYLEGNWEDWTLRTTLEWFDEQSGAVALVDDKGRMKIVRFKGTWSSHGKDGFGTFQLDRRQLLGRIGDNFRKRPVQLVKLEFSGAEDTATQLLTTAHCVLTWKPTSSEVRTEQVALSQMVERISTRWRQVFAGESYGDKVNLITLADPVDEWRRGEGELLYHEEFEVSGGHTPGGPMPPQMPLDEEETEGLERNEPVADVGAGLHIGGPAAEDGPDGVESEASKVKLEDILASEKVQVLRVKLTTHARTIKFRDKTCAESANFCCAGYNAAAQDAGHDDNTVPLIPPCEMYHRLWPASEKHDAFGEDQFLWSTGYYPAAGDYAGAEITPWPTYNGLWPATEEHDGQGTDQPTGSSGYNPAVGNAAHYAGPAVPSGQTYQMLQPAPEEDDEQGAGQPSAT